MTPRKATPLPATPRVINTWENIAQYLGVSVRCARNWEKKEQLPIHRLEHAKQASVYAFADELDKWRESHSTHPVAVQPNPFFRRPHFLLVAFAGILGFALALGWTYRSRKPAYSDLKPVPMAGLMGSETWPAISPDGKFVAFSWGDIQTPGLYLKELDTEKRIIRLGEGYTSSAQWSPDGRWIVYARWGPGERETWLTTADGTQSRRIEGIGASVSMSWFPDSKTLAAAIERRGEPIAIYSIDLTSNQLVRLTSPPKGSYGDLHCAVSPDGKVLAFNRYVSPGNGDFFVQRLDGKNTLISGGQQDPAVKLISNPEEPRRITWDETWGGVPEWAPDGHGILYYAWRQNQHAIWRVPVAAQSRSPSIALLADSYEKHHFTLSQSKPTRMAFEQTGAQSFIHQFPSADGLELVAPNGQEESPAISSDGNTIAFVSNPASGANLFLLNAQGGQPRQLTFLTGQYLESPRWSPDDRRIVFTSSAQGSRRLFVVDAAGGQPRRLTQMDTEEGMGHWSADGKRVYFRSTASGASQIWSVDIDHPSSVWQITTRGGFEAIESVDGKSLYYVKSPALGPIWQRSLSLPDGGEEQVVSAPKTKPGLWAVSRRGIHFLGADTKPSPDGSTPILTYDLTTKRLRVEGKVQVRFNQLPEFDASRDGSRFACREWRLQSHIYLVNDFR